MNIFDVGGLVTAIAVVLTLLLGTGIFLGINKIFDITYLGFGEMVGEWLVCCAVAALLINFLGGLLGGVFSVIWFIIKLALIIGIVGGLSMFIYNKIKGDKE